MTTCREGGVIPAKRSAELPLALTEGPVLSSGAGSVFVPPFVPKCHFTAFSWLFGLAFSVVCSHAVVRLSKHH